jgi:uncharacterized protein YbaP (TraB family)
MKKLLALLLAVILGLGGCVTYLGEAEYARPPHITPLMWRAVSPEGQSMYLFGSVHVGNEGLYPLPAYVMDAFYRSGYLAVEINLAAPDPGRQMEALPYMVYTDGRTIADTLGEDLHERLDAALTEAGWRMPSHLLYNFRAMTWYSALLASVAERAGLFGEYGIDLYFIHSATERGIEVLEVESLPEQARILAGFSYPLQKAILEKALDVDAYEQMLLEQFDAWKRGDYDEILAQLLAYVDALGEHGDEYWYYLVRRRDAGMAEAARGYMAAGKNVFFVVGLGHLLGDGSVVDLLIRAGYDVELVSPL